MGRTKDYFQEHQQEQEQLITIKLKEREYLSLSEEVRGVLQVDSREPTNIDYSDDPVWVELKNASSKAYRELKKYEFKKRHG